MKQVGERFARCKGNRLLLAEAVVFEEVCRCADNAKPAMAVAERNRHGPRDVVARCDVRVAPPGDVVRRVADVEDRIEQQLDVAGARADDEIDV
jgi:hypothetical protein